MKPKLQTWNDCMENIDLFEPFQTYRYDNDGQFSRHVDDHRKIGYFIWISNSLIHRIDGPAIIYYGDKLEWWFMDEEIEVTNQSQFDAWLVNTIKAI